MNIFDLSISNPKQKKRSQSAWNQIFPYYAGYPDYFARSIIASARLNDGAVVLDPWNGSGTTTYAASQVGVAALGLDINPVMVVIARSRTLPLSEADSLQPLAAEILRRAQGEQVNCDEGDPLLCWFAKGTADRLRSLELSIRSTLLGDQTLTPRGVNFDRVSSIAATFYVALFNLAKNLVAAFQSSNPTWLRKPRAGEGRAEYGRDDVVDGFKEKIKSFSDALFANTDLLRFEPAPVGTKLHDSTLPFGMDSCIDLVLTSPPYCTRIDYTAATRIQLAVLSPLLDSSVDDLSRSMIGSVKVPKEIVRMRAEWGAKCVEFLERVRAHGSYASGTYYLKTHIDYFHKMDRSLSNIYSSLKSGGVAVLVVQDSHYKDVHNDVPSILSEMAKQRGLKLKRREDFEVKTSMSGINPRARTYNKRCASVESVLCFQKDS
ncbi:DNA methyltransferase [Bradyrhizobium sp. HKCCYLS20291]|uniref:DNA methyltransferase n=1 Tax=Bradyrhizobium sp. HKCCYLS20291 TaxID=3420766 RepID=UPI003EC066BC